MVQEKVGRKVFSRGVWAPAATIAQVRSELAAKRSTEAYAKKQAAGAKRREKTQRESIEDFRGAVLEFLGFHQRHANLAAKSDGCSPSARNNFSWHTGGASPQGSRVRLPWLSLPATALPDLRSPQALAESCGLAPCGTA